MAEPTLSPADLELDNLLGEWLLSTGRHELTPDSDQRDTPAKSEAGPSTPVRSRELPADEPSPVFDGGVISPGVPAEGEDEDGAKAAGGPKDEVARALEPGLDGEAGGEGERGNPRDGTTVAYWTAEGDLGRWISDDEESGEMAEEVARVEMARWVPFIPAMSLLPALGWIAWTCIFGGTFTPPLMGPGGAFVSEYLVDPGGDVLPWPRPAGAAPAAAAWCPGANGGSGGAASKGLSSACSAMGLTVSSAGGHAVTCDTSTGSLRIRVGKKIRAGERAEDVSALLEADTCGQPLLTAAKEIFANVAETNSSRQLVITRASGSDGPSAANGLSADEYTPGEQLVVSLSGDQVHQGGHILEASGGHFAAAGGALGQCGAALGCAASRTSAASATLSTPASAMGTVTLRAGWYEAGRLHVAPPRVLHGVCPAAARGAASACSARGLTVTSGAGYRLLCDEQAGVLSISVARAPRGFACRRPADATGYAIGAEVLGTEAFAVAASCADGFVGAAAVAPCTAPGAAYTLSGCSPEACSPGGA
jgi:hypothetical protein